ncbi:cell envelope integrity protein CreD [Dyella tabacisoli]|uniref:Cell envelope integrity protein CreD n=1 Tax=Dyella tabacisoli TaxID=2282381 RepID=A0A369UNT2_9GAMM|nr:cell envelope integrity protein CreD [Dyella tabacisoli]RDD79979.1 cell envelope integrity protein CreD [Dyella tabacisoli]
MGGWTQSLTAKVFGIGVLALAMLIPLMQVQGLVSERQQLRESTVTQIAQGWGGRQVLGGLLLAVPTQRLVGTTEDKTPKVERSTEMVLADSMTIDATMAVHTRRYGIYGAPVYAATIQVNGRFLPEDMAQFQHMSTAQWQGDKAELRLLLSDLRGLQEVTELKINGRPSRFASSADRVGGLSSVVVPIDLDALGHQPIEFSLKLKLAGTESLQLLPLARTTDAQIQAPWSDPSFVGALLPAERKVDAQGFHARWHMLDLNRSYGQHWDDKSEVSHSELPTSAFGVELYQPADVYQRNERAGKYGLLFIALTFVAFFLIEVLQRLRVHPLQYLLVGAALATFYVLLLALSEQVGFGWAYAVAAASVVLIVGGYAMAVLHARRAGLLLGAALALVYAVLYGLIVAEQYALLIGAVVLLFAVALMMYLTRRIDWYAYTPMTTAPAATPATSADAANIGRS